MALKDDAVPSNPGLPMEVPAASLKTLRKRSLEGMRKQTRVESSDTSSDDEDRLVIEIWRFQRKMVSVVKDGWYFAVDAIKWAAEMNSIHEAPAERKAIWGSF